MHITTAKYNQLRTLFSIIVIHVHPYGNKPSYNIVDPAYLHMISSMDDISIGRIVGDMFVPDTLDKLDATRREWPHIFKKFGKQAPRHIALCRKFWSHYNDSFSLASRHNAQKD